MPESRLAKSQCNWVTGCVEADECPAMGCKLAVRNITNESCSLVKVLQGVPSCCLTSEGHGRQSHSGYGNAERLLGVRGTECQERLMRNMGDLALLDCRIHKRAYKPHAKSFATLCKKSDGIVVPLMTWTAKPCCREGSLLSSWLASEVSDGA